MVNLVFRQLIRSLIIIRNKQIETLSDNII